MEMEINLKLEKLHQWNQFSRIGLGVVLALVLLIDRVLVAMLKYLKITEHNLNRKNYKKRSFLDREMRKSKNLSSTCLRIMMMT